MAVHITPKSVNLNLHKEMKSFLETINGRYAGTTIAVAEGEVCQVGSCLGVDLFFPNDSLLAPLHFVVSNESDVFEIKGLADGLFVNNQPTKETKLAHGDFIFAGETLFYFTVEGNEFSNKTPLGKLVERLSKTESLCVLIDENSDRRIMSLLNEAKAEFRVLKEGVENLEGLTSNPLLIEIGANKDLLEKLVRTFWGHGRLVFFERHYSFEDAAKYLGFLLGLTQFENGVDLRFYDPRMLRVVLGEAEKKHAHYFFRGVKNYFVESQLPSHLFEFGWTGESVTANLIRLSNAVTKIPTQNEIAAILTKENLYEDFETTTKTCLKKLLPNEETDFHTIAKQSLSAIENYALRLQTAKIQLVALNALLGDDFTESEEVKKHFAFDNFSNDDKLEFLVLRLNQTRV
jgi:mRNA-degrading endonuclease HigB of HigAB toxin-antitoxin module